jgi:hypothetical protein
MVRTSFCLTVFAGPGSMVVEALKRDYTAWPPLRALTDVRGLR